MMITMLATMMMITMLAVMVMVMSFRKTVASRILCWSRVKTRQTDAGYGWYDDGETGDVDDDDVDDDDDDDDEKPQ